MRVEMRRSGDHLNVSDGTWLVDDGGPWEEVVESRSDGVGSSCRFEATDERREWRSNAELATEPTRRWSNAD